LIKDPFCFDHGRWHDGWIDMKNTTGSTMMRRILGSDFGRVRAGGIAAIVLLVAFPPGAAGQTSSAARISFAAVKEQIDGMKRRGLVSRKPRSLPYILDPELRRADSYCYSPYAVPGQPIRPAGRMSDETGDRRRLLSLADSGIAELAEQVRAHDPRGDLLAYKVVLAVMDEFFKEFYFGRQAKSSLNDFLKREGGLANKRTDPLFTVGARFWVERGADEKPEQGVLVCRLELRGFKVTLAPIKSPHTTLQERTDLTRLELVFLDHATGVVPLREYAKDAEGAMKAAIYAAFLDQIAVNFCLSPSVQSVLEDVDKKKVDIKGGSIARKGNP